MLAERTGAPARLLFEDLADRARRKADLQRQRKVLSGEAKMSAAVVGFLPIAMSAVLMAAGAGGVLRQ